VLAVPVEGQATGAAESQTNVGTTADADATSAQAGTDGFVESGFLTLDYALLARVKPGSARRIYVNSNAPLSNYDKIYLDRLTIWRDDDIVEDVENSDFQKVVDDLYAVTSRELGTVFTLVDEIGPDVGRLRIALVAIDDADDRLDVYVSQGAPLHADSSEPLPAGLRIFGRDAWLEGEMLDGATNEPIFAVADRLADVIPHSTPIETWRDLHAAFDEWAVQAAGRLTQLKKQR
jgi:hypothetical protein